MFNLKKGLFAPFFVTMLSFWESPKIARAWLLLYFLAAVAVSMKLWLAGPVHIDGIDRPVAAYNNFLIFKWSGFNLINELPLFIGNDLHYDLFKYSPTCAMAFLPFHWLPTEIGLFIWNLLNLVLPFWALHQIIGLNAKMRNILLLFLLGEGITSLLNAQSNGLVLGLLLSAIAAFQREKTGKAVLLILFSGFIKIFGWIFFLLFILRPKSLPRAIVFGAIYATILLLLPLTFVSSDYLISEYRWWFLLLQQDGGTYVKLSFMGWFQAWFGYLPPKNVILFVALILQLLPLWFMHQNTQKYRRGMLNRPFDAPVQYGASLLLWVVLFNHMSESATYVIAVGGIALFFSGEAIERRRLIFIILTAVLFFTVLGPTDIYPRTLRYWIVETAQLKAFAVIIAYFYMIGNLLRNKGMA